MGEFKNDMKDGHGVLTFKDGSKYSGLFFRDCIEGHGSIVYANRSRYTGFFMKGLYHGRGTLVEPPKNVSSKGACYEGLWV